VPRDVRVAYQSTWAFTEWEMSQPERLRELNYERIELLLTEHERDLRQIGHLADGQTVIHKRGVVAIYTRCSSGRTRTILCLHEEL
jgi:hypothetical protein